jgi:hypothetical protein
MGKRSEQETSWKFKKKVVPDVNNLKDMSGTRMFRAGQGLGVRLS